MADHVEKVIYDGDPGHDDVMAIVMAAGDPHIDLLAVTTVAGNTTLENATRNALMLMDVMDLDIPVVPGCAKPLLRKLHTAPQVHGEGGLDGAGYWEPKRKPVNEHAADFLIRTLMESDGDINVVTAGPMTNLALAMIREPRICDKIKQILFMGGGRYGNITGAAEFNIWVDAEAAKVVFDSPCKKVMCGLDLTYQACLTEEVYKKIAGIDTKLGHFLYDILGFFSHAPVTKEEPGPAINDPCPVAYLIDPKVFTTNDYYVDVMTAPGITYGMTVLDYYRLNPWEEIPAPNVTVGEKLDFDRFWEIMLNAIKALG